MLPWNAGHSASYDQDGAHVAREPRDRPWSLALVWLRTPTFHITTNMYNLYVCHFSLQSYHSMYIFVNVPNRRQNEFFNVKICILPTIFSLF